MLKSISPATSECVKGIHVPVVMPFIICKILFSIRQHARSVPPFFSFFHCNSSVISTIFDSPPQHFTTDVAEKPKKVLFTAARQGRLSVMQELLEGKPHLINLLDTQDSNNTILHLACEHHHLPVASWLLQQRSLMVNLSNQEGKSAFFVACEGIR